MKIEKASVHDVDAICSIDSMVIGNRSREGYLSKSIELGACLTAKTNDEIVGFAVFETSFFGHGYISLVIVNPHFRRQGAARELIAHIERNCPTEKLFTSTNESNDTMQKVCESLGFVRSGVIENLDEGDPEIVYFKRLR